MPSFFDRLGKVAQQTAAAAQQAANEGRIALEVRNIQGRFDDKAKDLGVLMYRRDQGEEVSDEAMLAVLQEMKEIEAEKKAKETEIEEMRKPAAAEATASAPAPQPAPTPQSAPTPEATAEPAPAEPAAVACSCGATNAPGAKFCTNCGQLLKQG